MTPERWKRVETLLNEALDLSPEERPAFLDEVCAGDPTLRAELENLLAADAAAGTFLEASAGKHVARLLAELQMGVTTRNPRPVPGRRVGTYELLQEIGRGGMGVVYQARDLRLGRFVALKFLSPLLSTDEQAKARFTAEARAASALDHPNICTIYEIGETEEGQLFIAMTYYEGQTLKQKLEEGPLPAEEALEVARQLAAGLAEAHRRSIVHRDIKPANIIITQNRTAKILDFGLAKLSNLQLTSTGSRLGTITYMSPEQIRGVHVDHRTDLWSLGVVLYEMLAGRPPFQGDTGTAVLYTILQTHPESVSALQHGVPPALEQVVMKLLSKDPGERYQDADEVLAGLETVYPAASPDRALPPASPWFARSRWRRPAALGLLTALAAAWVLWTGIWRSPEPSAPLDSSSVIAVLPFTVQGPPDLAYLREGMVNLLSTKLDGTGELRSIDPHALLGFLARASGDVLDPRRGREVAAHFSAGHFILGSVLEVGDRLQLTASLYDADGVEQARAHAEAGGELQLLAGVDELAQHLVAARLKNPNEQLASLAAMTTHSFPALQAYLEGERLLRDGRFRPAVEALQQAVALDSTFALAWYRLARAAGWTGPPPLNDRAVEYAFQYSEQLPQRTRTLVQGYHAYRKGAPDEAERLYRSILASHPDDMETWLLLGETLFHNNPFYGRSTLEAREPLERALSYDPDSREIMVHLMDLAAKEGRWAALDTLTLHYLEPVVPGEDLGVRHAYRALRMLTRADPEAQESALKTLQQAGPGAVLAVLIRVAPQLEDLSIAERLAFLLAAPANGEVWQATARLHQALFEAARGRWRGAEAAFLQAAPLDPGWTMVHRTLVHTLPFAPTSAAALEALRRDVARWNVEDTASQDNLHTGEWAEIKLFLLGLLSWRLEDHEAVQEYARQLGDHAKAREQGDISYRLAKTLDALSAWHRGQTAQALEALEAAQHSMPFHTRVRSPLYEQTLNRYLRAEVLYAEGRLEEALRWYASLYDGYYHWGAIYLGPAYLRRAEIYARLGNRMQAAAYYRRFIDLWKDCDPELHYMVEQAQLHLGRL